MFVVFIVLQQCEVCKIAKRCIYKTWIHECVGSTYNKFKIGCADWLWVCIIAHSVSLLQATLKAWWCMGVESHCSPSIRNQLHKRLLLWPSQFHYWLRAWMNSVELTIKVPTQPDVNLFFEILFYFSLCLTL